MTSVHLVRHGEVHNPDNIVYARLQGYALSARGHAQASAAGRWLCGQRRGDLLVFASPLLRARETAARIAEQLQATPVALDERLLEAGSWMEGLPRRFAPRRYLRQALRGEARAKAETASAVAVRMQAVVRAAAARNVDEVVLVSHQLPIGLARVSFEHGLGATASPLVRLAPRLFIHERCAHASVTTLELKEGCLKRLSYWKPALE